MEIPIFSAWFALQGGDVSSVIKSALAVKTIALSRDKRVTQSIRTAYDEEGISEANKRIRHLESELKRASDNTLNLMALKLTKGILTSYIMKAYNLFAAIKGLPNSRNWISRFHYRSSLTQRALRFPGALTKYRYQLTSVERLGGVRDILGARFNIELYLKDIYHRKTEAPEYRYITSHWKK